MNKLKTVIIVVAALLGIALISFGILYSINLSPVNKDNKEQIEVIIPANTTSREIGRILQDKKLIRNKDFFYLYVKLNNINNLKAATYKLSQNMSLKDIVNSLAEGNSYNPDEISITFKEGINMRGIATAIKNNTNNSYESVFEKLEEEEYIKSVVNKYWFLEDVISNKDIYYPLEGYLYPDTYKFLNKNVSVESVFKAMLDKMDKELTKNKEQIENSDKTVHELLTMASVVELEGARKEDRSTIASVFYNRLNKKMSLGSDVTTYYAVKVDMHERDLYKDELNSSNPYNTRGPGMEGKLPIGPICITNINTILAAINPKETNYLYFVADKNKNVFFTSTYAEHQKKVKEIKDKGDWIEW